MGLKVSVELESPERINELARYSRPLLRDRNGRICLAEGTCDYFNSSYPWTLKPGKEMVNLEEIAKVNTYHTFSFSGFFKPTVAEVLSQICDWWRPDYYLVDGPETLDDQWELAQTSHHRAVTTLYMRKR